MKQNREEKKKEKKKQKRKKVELKVIVGVEMTVVWVKDSSRFWPGKHLNSESDEPKKRLSSRSTQDEQDVGKSGTAEIGILEFKMGNSRIQKSVPNENQYFPPFEKLLFPRNDFIGPEGQFENYP
jgi:hypothetical protein